MKKTILALAIIGVSGIGFAGAVAAQAPRLSDIPLGAIHAPGIGPGYIFPSYGTETAMVTSPVSAAPMTLGADTMAETTMPSGEARALSTLRAQGFTTVQDLRPGPNGTWHGLLVQRGGTVPISVDGDGVVSIYQR